MLGVRPIEIIETYAYDEQAPLGICLNYFCMAELWAAYNKSMDTIIYLYHSRECETFRIEKWQEREYCLIRLGIPALLWKNLRKLEKCFEKDDKQSLKESMTQNQSENMTEEQVWRRSRSRWFGRKNRNLQNVNCELMLEIEQEEQLKALQQQLHPLLNELSELQTALCLLGDNPYWTYCVYEDFLRERIDTWLWREHWTIPEFQNYHEYVWSEELMQYATCEHFMILGYAPYLPGILHRYAGKMRSVKWFLEPEQYTEAVQEFVEDFYEEYGLAISLRLLEEGWNRVRSISAVPVNILDFSQEEKLSAWDVAKGSVWLDMDSLEGKERRFETRNPQIAYFSLKKQWKQRQKEPSHLDTIGKNRYNT